MMQKNQNYNNSFVDRTIIPNVTMANSLSRGQTGVLYRVKLKDCLLNEFFDVSEIVDQKITFYKSDGVVFDQSADLTEDEANPGEFFIEYFNTFPEESILDLVGEWEYGAAAQLVTGDIFETTGRVVFWVV